MTPEELIKNTDLAKVASQGALIYQEVKKKYEENSIGKFLAIDIDSKEQFLASTSADGRYPFFRQLVCSRYFENLRFNNPISSAMFPGLKLRFQEQIQDFPGTWHWRVSVGLVKQNPGC